MSIGVTLFWVLQEASTLMNSIQDVRVSGFFKKVEYDLPVVKVIGVHVVPFLIFVDLD